MTLPIKNLFRLRGRAGEIGIEIEVEGKNIPKNPQTLLPYWEYKIETSLRGDESGEYILKKPIKFSEVENALIHLWGVFKDNDTRIDDSNRTSVHVHLNFQKAHLDKIASFSALYLAFEEILTKWCGEYREGNLFCLRGKDAPGGISSIRQFLKTGDTNFIHNENLKYLGLNPYSLTSFGSIEIRTLRGVSDYESILFWVNILKRLYTLADEMSDPRQVCEMFSAEGPVGFFNEVLKDLASPLLLQLDMTDEQVKSSLYEGIRLAQDLCYCRDWSKFEREEPKEDPFGRAKTGEFSLGSGPNIILTTLVEQPVSSMSQFDETYFNAISQEIDEPFANEEDSDEN